MNRRALLGALGTATVGAVAGCLGNDEPTTVVDSTFETGVDTSNDVSAGPTVTIEDDEVIVVGQYSTGNSCYDPHFQGATYDENDDELRISVGRQHDGSSGDCDDLEETASYRVVVTFDGAPPQSVHATEDIGGETTVESDSGWL